MQKIPWVAKIMISQITAAHLSMRFSHAKTPRTWKLNPQKSRLSEEFLHRLKNTLPQHTDVCVLWYIYIYYNYNNVLYYTVCPHICRWRRPKSSWLHRGYHSQCKGNRNVPNAFKKKLVGPFCFRNVQVQNLQNWNTTNKKCFLARTWSVHNAKTSRTV